jgi:hypothetical protein
MDTYDDLHNLTLYDYGRFAEMDAPIFADEARTLVDSRKLKQLEHGAMRQLLRRIEELEEKLRLLQEALEEKKGKQLVSSLK